MSGFEEDQDFRTDSLTCSREGFRIVTFFITSNKWELNFLDVKTAFLQGKLMEQTVYVKPPKEASTNKIWKLRKCVHGLANASRYWYLKLREEFIKLNAKPVLLDQGIFIWYENSKPIGMMVCFVDDVMWGGSELFVDVVKKLKLRFHIGTESH